MVYTLLATKIGKYFYSPIFVVALYFLCKPIVDKIAGDVDGSCRMARRWFADACEDAKQPDSFLLYATPCPKPNLWVWIFGYWRRNNYICIVLRRKIKASPICFWGLFV